ncbi:MAG: diaminopimelate decarboxylase [Pyrinomonas methylaliphatogenes]|jgi:diaminopimelate decarboxylase|nr:diaminopimelate decarboxylase [Pyrinomonas methylaliphatogenes]
MIEQRIASFPAWAIAGYLEPQRGHLAIDGVDAIELARQHDTPLFVFSESRIRRNIERLTRAAREIARPVKFCYAAKANSTLAILRAVRDAGIDIEVNSGGELYKAQRAGFRPNQIIFNGTSKTEAEISEAIAAGIYAINVDSIYEIELIERTAERLGRRARIALRLVPEVETRSHPGLQTALLTSKFGISAAEVSEAFARVLARPELVHLCGIHIHVGSQTPDVEPFARAFEAVWRHLIEIYDRTGHAIEHINLGGGFPVNYLRDRSQADALPAHEREMLEADLDPAEVLREVMRVAREEARRARADHLLDRITFLFEPGRSIVADAGVLLTTVRNVKRRPETGDTWLLTDAGFNLLLSMSTYHWYYHLISAERADAPHDMPYKVAGPLCDSGDVYFDIERQGRLPDYRLLPRDVRPGEVLALLNAGAYTVAQMFAYNGRPLPAIVMVRDDGCPRLVRRRDSYEDLLMNELD